MLDVCCFHTSYDEYIAVVKTGTNVSSQPTCCLSVTLLSRSVARKCCSSQVSLCHSTRCPVCCMRNGTRSVPRNLTRHRRGRILTRLVDTHPWVAVCTSQATECLNTIHVWSLSSFCCSWPVLHAQLTWYFGFTLRMVAERGCSTLIHGSTS